MAIIGDTNSGMSDWSQVSAGELQSLKYTVPSNGWITSVNAHARGETASTTIKIGAWYDVGNGRNRILNGATKTIGTTAADRTEGGLSLRIADGDDLWIGMLCLLSSGQAAELKADFGGPDNRDGRFYPDPTGGSTLPNPLAGTFAPDYHKALWAEYQPNVAPTIPSLTSPANAATGVSHTPTLSFTANEGADAAYDYIKRFNVVIEDAGTGVPAYGSKTTPIWTNTGTTDPTDNTFSFTVPSGELSSDTQYRWTVQTEDSWGEVSPYSGYRTFTTVTAPGQPTPISPIGRQNTLTPAVSATHVHSGGLNAVEATIQLLSSNGGVLTTYTTGAINVAPGSPITVAMATLYPTGLAWSTNYKWRMKVKDVNGYGAYTLDQDFNTDFAPSKPTNLSPSGDTQTSSATFTANISDPENDTITAAQVRIYHAVTAVNTVPATSTGVTVNNTTKTISYTSAALTYGNRYYWQARATDGIAPYGEWSDPAYFVYAQVPSVGMVAPSGALQNLVPQPSAEYDTTDLSAHWTFTVPGTSTIARLEEDNAPYGTHVWQAIADGTGEVKAETTDFIPVTATKAHAFFVWAKGITGTPTSSFQVLCYNASSTLVDTLTPGEAAANQLSAEVVPNTWTRYGGLVMDTAWALTGAEFPATTTKVKLRFIAAASGTSGTVQFDAFMASELAANPKAVQDRIDAAGWYGYADGDYEGFGDNGAQTATYSWSGTPGDSVSTILSVLEDTSPNVVINYTHPSASAKTNDRLVIQEWRNNEWRDYYDSNPPITETSWPTNNGNRERIPIPGGTLDNEGRYRLMVQVLDSTPLLGETDWVEFDVYYVGPAQLDIVLAEAIPEKAQTRIQWNTTNILVGTDFAGIEVQRIDLDGEEDTVILNPVITNPDTTEYIDHYPASGRNYRYRIRQKQNTASGQVGGFWSSIDVTCEYVYNFIKDVSNPEIFTAYDTEAQNLVGYTEDAPVGILSPWGAARPTVLQRWKLRTRTGEVVAGFFPDAGIEYADFPDADTRFDRASRIMRRRQTIAILLAYPEPTKVFAAIIGEARTTFPYPPTVRGVEFSWQEVSWSEDYYEQNGLT